MVRYNQSLVDIALQKYGSLEGLVELAMLNGKSITSDLQIGETLQFSESVSVDIAQYFEASSLQVTTGATMFYPAIIDLEPITLDFGTVLIGSSNTLSFDIKNISNTVLAVSSITLPFATYTIDWSSGNIPANTIQTVNVTYTPTVAGEQSGNITINSNAVSGANTVAVTATGFKEIGAIFNGSTNYAQAPYSAGNTFAHTASFTYSFYLRMGNVTPAQIIMERQTATNSQTVLIGGGFIEFVKFSSTGYQFIRANTAISINTLYKIDIVSSGGTIADLKIYINGVLQTLTILANQSVSGTPSDAINFMRRGDSSLFANGTLYYIRAYNKALSAGEIAEQNSITIPSTALANLVANWDIQEAQNSTALLEQISANNATLYNFTAGQLLVSRVDTTNTPI